QPSASSPGDPRSSVEYSPPIAGVPRRGAFAEQLDEDDARNDRGNGEDRDREVHHGIPAAAFERTAGGRFGLVRSGRFRRAPDPPLRYPRTPRCSTIPAAEDVTGAIVLDGDDGDVQPVCRVHRRYQHLTAAGTVWARQVLPPSIDANSPLSVPA
ncbi:MAG: hypothetical protein M5U18_19880, partial [Dehalococcoidia bacterium]|nr:hypothetical protein [Dehalococcoidia bacterium]